MNIRQEFIEKKEAELEPIFYKFPKTGKKFKFVIKPLLSADFITDSILKEAMKDLSNGQSIDEAGRIAAENFKKKFQTMGQDSAFRMIIEKGLVFPKIVNKTEGLLDDELPFLYLDADMKNFILKNLMRISPIFKG